MKISVPALNLVNDYDKWLSPKEMKKSMCFCYNKIDSEQRSQSENGYCDRTLVIPQGHFFPVILDLPVCFVDEGFRLFITINASLIVVWLYST